MSNNKIKVTELDFNNIRENLKEFLRGQSTFSDYDFDGSALSTLIDVLAYNTHYNALYTNMAINEMYLDSASKRNSIISIGNNFGYLPRSARSSRVNLTVTVTIPNSQIPVRVLPAFSAFNTILNNTSYTFYTLQDYTAPLNGNTYTFQNVIAYQGEPQTMLFSCTEENQKFMLPHKNIDISTIILTVSDTAEVKEYERYAIADNIMQLNATSKVYFLKEMDDQFYQLSFGVNNVGKPILPGNIVEMSYLTTAKDAANGASVFSYASSVQGGTVSVIAMARSFGGMQEESKEEIRLNVSQSFFDQDRAITAADYSAIVKRYYDDIDSISVWGGEDNSPPQYGKVYLCIKPASGPLLTSVEKSFITESIIKAKGVVTIVPEIVDPTYIELDLSTTVYYNPNNTSRSREQLKVAVIQAIEKYNQDYLEKFDGAFRYSKFSAMVDNVDQSISSNITKFRLFCEIVPKYNVASTYTLNLVNPIYTEGVPEESFLSTGFYIDSTDKVYYMDDDGVGNIRLFNIVAGTNEKVFFGNVGTINYSKGLISVRGLTITNLLEPNLYFKVKTSSYDVLSVRNQIVTIPEDRINVNVLVDNSSTIGRGNAIDYTFTPSR
jgi:hypothetical protein